MFENLLIMNRKIFTIHLSIAFAKNALPYSLPEDKSFITTLKLY
jgi:hypothetical protein